MLSYRQTNQIAGMLNTQVAVVVPVYQQPALLAEAVLSAIDQDLQPPPLLILVNDGCPLPETDEQCRLLQRAYPNSVLYIKQRNRGLAAARNAGIELAVACCPSLQAVYFLDADNRLEPHCLRRMLDTLRSTGAGWVFPDIDVFGVPMYAGMAGEYSAIEHLLGNISDAGSLVGRAVFDAGVRFDESMRLGLEDWEFWLQAIQRGFRGHHAPDAGFRYRRRPESMLQANSSHHGDVISYIRRKHAAWMNPASAVALEHEEVPRYAIIQAGAENVALCTDPRQRSRTVSLVDFTVRAAMYSLFEAYRFLPRYLVVVREGVLPVLEKRGTLSAVFWELERAAARSQGRASASALIEIAAMEGLFLPSDPEPAQVNLNIEMSSEGWTAPAFIDHLRTALKLARDQRGLPFAFVSSDNGRRKDSLTAALDSLFDVEALYPVASRAPRVGFITASVDAEVLNLARAARAAGCFTVLFLADGAPDSLEPAYRKAFDAYAPFTSPEGDPEAAPETALRTYMGAPLPPDLPPDAVRNLEGLLSSMNIVVNHSLTNLLPLASHLRSLRTRMVFSIQSEDRAQLQSALAFEHVLAGAIVNSETLREQCIASGFPSSKISTAIAPFLPAHV
jgi:glycosyltransferase involved in cell wall biosynthesis